MAQQRAHDVHLRVARAGVRARAVDLLEDDRRLGDVEAAAAVLLRDQRGEPAGVGERLDERIGIAGTLVDVLPVRAVELSAQLANSIAIFLVFVCSWIDVSHSRDSGFGTRSVPIDAARTLRVRVQGPPEGGLTRRTVWPCRRTARWSAL